MSVFQNVFTQNRVGNGNDDISSEEDFEKFKNQERYLFTTRTVHFCLNILILSRDEVPLMDNKMYLLNGLAKGLILRYFNFTHT
jgi:hypothetical protein